MPNRVTFCGENDVVSVQQCIGIHGVGNVIMGDTSLLSGYFCRAGCVGVVFSGECTADTLQSCAVRQTECGANRKSAAIDCLHHLVSRCIDDVIFDGHGHFFEDDSLFDGFTLVPITSKIIGSESSSPHVACCQVCIARVLSCIECHRIVTGALCH